MDGVNERTGQAMDDATVPATSAARQQLARRMRRRGDQTRWWWLVPTLYIIFLLVPIYWLVNMSFKTNREIVSSLTLYPHQPTIANYAVIFTDPSRSEERRVGKGCRDG